MTQQALRPWRMPTSYLNGFFYDHVLIFGVVALAITSGLIVHFNNELFIPVLLADVWLLGYHHVISTFTKLAGTQQDRKENKFLIFYLPFIVLGSVFTLYYFIGIWSVVTIYFFWQWYHYTRQAYGISAFYRRKSNIKITATPQLLDYLALWAVPVWGVISRCAQGWETFLFLPVWLPYTPQWLESIVGVIACGILLAWIAMKLFDWSKGQLAYAPFAFLMSHHLTFFIAYIYIPDITIGWLVANIWHNAQYILFVWLFNKNRFRPEETKKQSPILHWLCQKGPYRALAYFAACLLVSTIVYSVFDFGTKLISGDDAIKITAVTVVLYQTINFHHYVVDSMIWKARKKDHQKIMKINA